MKPKLIAMYLLIVLLPLTAIIVLGLKAARYEQDSIERQFQAFAREQLAGIDRNIKVLIEESERNLLSVLESAAPDANVLRQIADKHPLVSQAFALDPSGRIIYPNPQEPLSQNEWDFLQRARDVLNREDLLHQSQSDSPVPQQGAGNSNAAARMAAAMQQQATGPGSAARHNWCIWFWGSDLSLLLWREDGNGNIIGAELDRARLLADIIAILPDESPASQSAVAGAIVISNASGQSLYQWGRYQPQETAAQFADISLAWPLSAWRLKYYPAPGYLKSPGAAAGYLNLTISVAAAALALVVLATWFYRENTRQMRIAAQQVTFVNQVSHELKTPLTNIRMYAELLEDAAPEDDPKTKRFLSVIVAESRRLSRLIANILCLSRKENGWCKLRMGEAVVDDVISSVLAGFSISFQQHSIDVHFDKGAGDIVRVDTDVLEQILGNLISNVEKYAASGRYLAIKSRRDGSITSITVADKGPGIPARLKEKVFRPFWRMSNKLTDGVSGTGIGLTIARDLARLHGGDIAVVPGDSGATFEVTLLTEPAPVGGPK